MAYVHSNSPLQRRRYAEYDEKRALSPMGQSRTESQSDPNKDEVALVTSHAIVYRLTSLRFRSGTRTAKQGIC